MTNKRIEQLLGQALDKAVPETWTTLTPEQFVKVSEMFAELIVRECLDMCKRVKDDCDWREKEYDIDQMQRQIGVNLCVREIKQQFDLQ